MCKSRSATEASEPRSRRKSKTFSSSDPSSSPATAAAAISSSNGTLTDPGSRLRGLPLTSTASASSSNPTSSSSSSSALSLASLRSSLPDAPALYSFPELCAATNSFLAKRLSGASSSTWRCTLRGRDVVVVQRPLRGRRGGDSAAALPSRLADLCKSHHRSIARFLGISLADDHIYLVYEFVPGASLADCLRNARNPGFTPLASWVSRVQVAVDIAQGLEYIHHQFSGVAGVHNRLKSSAIIVTEPDLRARICHFGTAHLSGEVTDPPTDGGEITPIPSPSTRSGERQRHIEGTRGYMAPEVLADGAISRQSDVFAFGVVLLELLSGEDPLEYRYDKERKEFDVVSVISTARAAIGRDEENEGEEEEARQGRVRQWVDRRLRDSFPVGAASKLLRVALRCVEAEPAARPGMTWVAGKLSMVYLESKVWAEKVRVPTDISVSMAPR